MVPTARFLEIHLICPLDFPQPSSIWKFLVKEDKFLKIISKMSNMLVTAIIMTPLLWTFQAVDICLSTSRSTHHHKRGRDWDFLWKMFHGNCNLSHLCWDWTNSEHAGWRATYHWERWSGNKGKIHQHTEATWRSLGDKVYNSKTSPHTSSPPTFQPGE